MSNIELEFEKEEEKGLDSEVIDLLAYSEFMSKEQIKFIDNELLIKETPLNVWIEIIKEVIEDESFGYFNAIDYVKVLFDTNLRQAISDFRMSDRNDITEKDIVKEESLKSKVLIKKIMEFSTL
ncbi:hypothetical protein SAMN05192566_0745 [Methylophilus rhizosphaerae]|uniref:Uncharacterized protein n=1 Tax=Methylophilus rhizosphaerae TaxID=492660 RepID=A0A1G9A8H7_9PROT|nr:hypothetical protein [Methylophilus rhizosphaerae]SDK23598.1 hypothetical protein SAMN05192566_0745 [Methylophilus rhizosphaerae]